MDPISPQGDFGSAFDPGRALGHAWTAIRRNLPLLWLGGCVRGCLRGGGGGGGGGEEHERQGALLQPAADAWARVSDGWPQPSIAFGGIGPFEAGLLGVGILVALALLGVALALWCWFMPGWIRAQAEIVRTGTSSFSTLFGGADAFGRMVGWTLLQGLVVVGVLALVVVPGIAAATSDTLAVRLPATIVAIVAGFGFLYAWLGLLLGNHLVALEGATAMEALEHSWEWMRGHRWAAVFFWVIVGVVSAVFGLAGLCVLLVGAIVTFPLSNAMLDYAVTDAYLRYTRSWEEQQGWPEA